VLRIAQFEGQREPGLSLTGIKSVLSQIVLADGRSLWTGGSGQSGDLFRGSGAERTVAEALALVERQQREERPFLVSEDGHEALVGRLDRIGRPQQPQVWRKPEDAALGGGRELLHD